MQDVENLVAIVGNVRQRERVESCEKGLSRSQQGGAQSAAIHEWTGVGRRVETFDEGKSILRPPNDFAE